MYLLDGRLRLSVGAASRSSEATPSTFATTAPQWSGAMNGPVELTALLGPHRERYSVAAADGILQTPNCPPALAGGARPKHHTITRRPDVSDGVLEPPYGGAGPRVRERHADDAPDEAGDCVLEALLHGRSRSRALGSLPTPRCPATCLRYAVGGAGPTARGRRRTLQLDKHRHADTARARAAAERRSGVRSFGRGTEP